MRIVIADDEMLLREGLARLLDRRRLRGGRQGDRWPPSSCARSGSPTPTWRSSTSRCRRPTPTRASSRHSEIRASHPDVGVLVLSHYLESVYAMRLLEEHPERVGYLLKDRVSDIAVLADALRRIADGECVLDPTIVAAARAAARASKARSAELTDREREVLELIAEGRSNQAIGDRLLLSPKTVETHIRQIFQKLDLGVDPDSHRRVLAVLAFLRS